MANGESPSLDQPRPLPGGYGNRLFLYVMRRMATAGVNDAHAANAMLGAFGRSYRRPLVLMRAMMLEMARTSSRKILIAPCCCRSEEHTSELQSLMRISYAVFCLKK